MNTVQPATDRATGPATRPLAHAAYTGEVNRTQVAGIVRAWRRTAHRPPANRRPSEKQIRALLQLASGGAR